MKLAKYTQMLIGGSKEMCCDLVSGLEESMHLEWHGDVDFGTGDLQCLYEKYLERLKGIDVLKSNVFSEKTKIIMFLQQGYEVVKEDVAFITNGMYGWMDVNLKPCVCSPTQ